MITVLELLEYVPSCFSIVISTQKFFCGPEEFQ